jgi:glucokinase
MYISFDIGGTKMRVAASRDCKEIMGEPIKVDTPKKYEDGLALIEDVARQLAGEEKIKAVGGGVGGPLSSDRNMLLSSNKPNLSNWVKKPLVTDLSNILRAPVYVANDTAIVGLGEAYNGAGMGHNIVVYITVSTGVGGARIVNGKIDHRVYGFEPGHQMIDMDNTLCKKCQSGTLEDMVSGTATALRFGKKAYEVEDPKLWEEELPFWLAHGLRNTVLHWSPDVVVLGGSMIVGDPAISVEATELKLREILKIFPEPPVVKKAEHDAFGGIYGGFAFMRQNLD